MVGRGMLKLASLALLLSVNGVVSAGDLDSSAPLSEKPKGTLFPDAPAEWRDYFIHTRRAERAPDALTRCLAYPDLPGNRWPLGYSAMHCHYHHAPTLSPTEIGDYLARDDVAELEAQVESILARHAHPGVERESSHRFFHQLDMRSPDIDRITARWVELAPDSAFAAVARAKFFSKSGWHARGSRFAGRTLQGQMSAMSEWFDKAEAEYRRAIVLRPDFLEAYIGLMHIGKADRQQVGEWAFDKASELDPSCAEVAYIRMNALLPRWGGSYPRMQSYWSELESYLETTPMLANQRSAIYVDYVSVMEQSQRYQPEAAGILELAVLWSANEEAMHIASDSAINYAAGPRDPHRGAALLLQESRYRTLNAWGNRALADYFLQRDAEWALRFARVAVMEEPDDGRGRYLLAAANYNNGNFEDAEQHYLFAVNDDTYRQASLRELGAMWLFDAGLPPAEAAVKAKPHIDRLLAQYPDDGRALLLHFHAENFAGRAVPVEAINKFVEIADLGDPLQASERARILDHMQSKVDPAPAPD